MALVLAFGLGILIQALWQWLSGPVAVVLWLALVFSLRDFFAPTTYHFRSEELVVDGPLKVRKSYPWRRFRSYVKDRNGLFLSPYLQKRVSESQRGLFLPLSPHQRQEALAFCQSLGMVGRSR
jgi:hypothetical protein